jgi:hypothetical protein
MFPLSPLPHLLNLGRMPNSIVVLKHALRDHPKLLEQLKVDGDGGEIERRVGGRDA